MYVPPCFPPSLSLSAVCNLSPLSIRASDFRGWMNPYALKPLQETVCVCLQALCFCVAACHLSWRRPFHHMSCHAVTLASAGFVWGVTFLALFTFDHIQTASLLQLRAFWVYLCFLGGAVSTFFKLAVSEVTSQLHRWLLPHWLVRTTSWQPHKGFSQQLSHMVNHVSLPPEPLALVTYSFVIVSHLLIFYCLVF